jgi:outer membrane autotransporter protein
LAYSTVHLDHKWYRANTEKSRGTGYGCNLGLGKDFKLSKWFYLGPDIQVFFMKTGNSNYQFIGTNINCALKFFLMPGKRT